MIFSSVFSWFSKKPAAANKKYMPKASFDAGKSGRRLIHWIASRLGPKRRLYQLSLIRARARDLARNNPLGISIIERWTTNLIGSGITPKPFNNLSDDIRTKLDTFWRTWVAEADFDGLTDYYGLQTLACRSWLEGGECLIRLIHSGPTIPLELQVLEGEYLSFKNDENLASGGRIIDGVEFDQRGKRVAYWLHKDHPGDGYLNATEYVRVPASEIIHLFEPIWPGQIRGVPELVSVLVKLKDLDDFDDANLLRQKISTMFAGFIKKPPEDTEISDAEFDNLIQAIKAEGLGDDTKTHQLICDWFASKADKDGDLPPLEPGGLQELYEGEDITFSDPPDSGSNYVDFHKQQTKLIAAARYIPYSILTFDFDGVNDRVMRVALNEFRRRIRQRVWNVIVPNLCVKVRKAWIDAAILAGLLPANDFTIRLTEWVLEGFAYINPVQDIQAKILAIGAGLTSRSAVVSETGEDVEAIDKANAQDKERAKKLGLDYSTQIKTKSGNWKVQNEHLVHD